MQEKASKRDVFFWDLVSFFLSVLRTIPEEGDVDENKLDYCERFMELLIDVEVGYLQRAAWVRVRVCMYDG